MRPPTFLPFAMAACAALAAPPSFSLGNGMAVIVLPERPSPLFKAVLHIPWDPSLSRQERQALGSAWNAAWETAGYGPWSAAACRRNQAELGIRLQFRAGQDGLTWTLRAPGNEQGAAMEHLAHAILRPRWDGPELEAFKIRSFGTHRDQGLAGRSWQAFQRALGNPAIPPSTSLLASISLDRLHAVHRRHVQAGRAVLVLQGLTDVTHGKELALLHLGAWGSPKAALESQLGSGQNLEGRCFASTERRPGASMLMGIPESAGDPFSLASRSMLGTILKARMEASPILGSWSCQVPSGTLAEGPLLLSPRKAASLAEACEAALRALESIRKLAVTREELERARIAWKGAWTAMPLHPLEYANVLARLKGQGIAPEELVRAVDGLTPERLTESLQVALAVAEIRVLMLGVDPKTVPALRKTLEALGLGTLAFDTDG